MGVAWRMFISVRESQTQGHDCNLGHESIEMGYELKTIMPIYLQKCSAEKAKVLYGSQKQYDLSLCENPCFKWNTAYQSYVLCHVQKDTNAGKCQLRTADCVNLNNDMEVIFVLMTNLINHIQRFK
jgi:hypothetical protein